MAINLAVKYSDTIATSFHSAATISDKGASGFEFTGVKGLKVYTPITVPMVDYQRGGTSRFGLANEMQDTVQELILSEDKAFSFIIDKGNNSEQHYTKEAGRMMALQISERVVPTIESYCLKRICNLAGLNPEATSEITSINIVDEISKAATAFDEAFVPVADRFLVVTPSIYSAIRLAPDFLSVETLAKESLSKGVLGSVFGFSIIKVPSSYMPENIHFTAFSRNSVIFPHKLRDARLHEDAPGISGAVVEGRWIYDAFVLAARCSGVYALMKNGTKTGNPTAAYASGKVTITAGVSTYKILYTSDGSDPRYSADAVVYSSPIAVSTLDDNFLLKIVGVSSTGSYSDIQSFSI